MKTRKLGNSDLHLTEIGFGAWAIGGGNWEFGWGPQDDEEAIAAMRRAVELGINWIDTAAVYGLGHSEELVAKAFAGRRKEVIIATKCSLIWDEKRKVHSSLASASIRQECDASLRRLNTDYIDLYQIHWPDDNSRIEEGWGMIDRLISEGKIRYGGVSNFAVSDMERCKSIRPVTSLQPPYSMLRRGVEKEILPYCAREKIGVVVYSPMERGLLTGKFDISKVAPDDHRQRAKDFQQPRLGQILAMVEKLRGIANRYGKTPAQLALQWTLRRPEVTSAIAGARRPSQIEETVGGSGWSLTKEDIAEIEQILQTI